MQIEIKDLRLVELELHSYCNRTCAWCPNNYIDRKSFSKELDGHIFITLLKELKNKNFSGVISLSRYNEPFSKPEIITNAIDLIHSFLPNNKIVANTNGDFDYEIFKPLIEITEMDYDNNKIEKIEDNFRIMKLRNINNRGGALQDIKKHYIRTTPCYEPMRFVGINYDGTISPCCNIRNDIDSNKQFIMGNLNDDSLENILNYLHNQDFRKITSLGKQEYFPEVCKHCDKESGRYTSDAGLGGKQT